MQDNPIVRWIESNQGSPSFEEALRKLLGFACVEWIRRGQGVGVSPEEAVSRFLCLGSQDFALESWLESPAQYKTEIADFCEKSKNLPLPEDLRGELPRLMDLRGVKCPRNSMKVRLALSGLPVGHELEIWLDEGSPIENVPGSLVADGHKIKKREKKANFWVLVVVKAGSL